MQASFAEEMCWLSAQARRSCVATPRACVVYSMDALASLAQHRKTLKAQLKEATKNLGNEAHVCEFLVHGLVFVLVRSRTRSTLEGKTPKASGETGARVAARRPRLAPAAFAARPE